MGQPYIQLWVKEEINMSTLHSLREGINETWGDLVEGWQKLSQKAYGAITRFTPGKKNKDEGTNEEKYEITSRNSGWGMLAAEMFDDGDKIVVRLESPGMDENDFELRIQNNYLVISGEKQIEREHKDGHYHVTECAYGFFERAIPLPDGVLDDADKIIATYKKGVLRVELPKLNSRKRNKITVKAG